MNMAAEPTTGPIIVSSTRNPGSRGAGTSGFLRRKRGEQEQSANEHTQCSEPQCRRMNQPAPKRRAARGVQERSQEREQYAGRRHVSSLKVPWLPVAAS